jgi:hypothetical protein
MKRTGIIGLCLAATCAMFALTASSALATENLPHFGKCVAKTGGKYSNTGCTKLATKVESEKDEWEPLTTLVPFTSAKEKETGPAALESASGTVISCLGQTEKSGEYGPGDQVKNVVGKFTGCEAFTASCTSEKAVAGEIDTKKLHGEPGIIKKELKEEKNIDGNDLRGEEGELLAEFSCSTVGVTVRGGVVVAAQQDSTGGTTGEITNKMENKVEVEFRDEPKGKQLPSVWTPNGGGISNSEHKTITEILEGNTGTGYEPSGQFLTTVQSTIGTKPKVELRQCEKTIVCAN